jgi:hypothetical protein
VRCKCGGLDAEKIAAAARLRHNCVREVNVRTHFGGLAMLLLGPVLSGAATLSPQADHAFAVYVSNLESRLKAQHLKVETYAAVLGRDGAPRPEVEAALQAGEVFVERVNGGNRQVSGGLLHHWRAAALVSGATPEDMLELLRSYDHLDRYYAPEVVSSRLLTGSGEQATLAMRFRKQRIVTVVLDAEFETRSAVAGGVGYSISRSTHFWQIDHPGGEQERRRREGHDDGYLWRLNSYWSFEQRREGLLIECEAVSLTRDVPVGLGWLIMPIIETLPRTSLEFTLAATRNALLENAKRRHHHDRANRISSTATEN